jgi:putative PIN family toxin of toxin-antitoxin system
VIRAVIDTNVLVSAMISSAGNEALVVMAINQKLVTPCFSPEILKEYSEVLLRPKFAFSADEVDTMLGLLGRCGHRLKPVSVSRVSTLHRSRGRQVHSLCFVGKSRFPRDRQ